MLIAGLLSYVIYRQIFSREDAGQLFDNFKLHLQNGEIVYLLLVLILMPINWLLESKKWQLLSANFEKQSLLESVKTVLGGVVCSLFSPARIGEYGGRVLFVKAENNWKAVAATMVGSLSQLVIVLSVGGIGLITWLSVYTESSAWLGHYALANPYVLLGIILMWAFITLIGLAIYFNVDIFINILKRVKYINKFERFFQGISVLKAYSQADLWKALSYSFVRYLVYSVQYWLLLLFFGLNIGFLSAISGISTIFFIQTGVPLPPIWDLFARGEVAIIVWGSFGANELSVLAATFSLWVINLILPSILGLVFIVKINIIKSIGYDQKENKTFHS
jgi:hypothetical protein